MLEGTMKYFNDLFPNIPENDIIGIFKKYDMKVPNNITFSNRANIVVGSNGSGKTRFLKIIQELYQKDKNVQIIYGYFPDLSNTFVDKKDDSLPQYSLYESLDIPEASFDDFLKAIEQQGTEFITELLLARSIKQKERKEKIWNKLTRDFYNLSKKKLVKKDNIIYVQDGNQKQQILSEALQLFSPGELMLFYMSIFLAIQKNSKDTKRIIILDEPECHLHPRALRSFINMLLKHYKFDTIWIATHSLLLIPEFGFNNLVYTMNGEIIKKSGAIYQNLMSDMLGEDTQKIENFFISLSKWQFCEFISECFTNPTVIDTVNPKDEQVQLFVRFLKEHKKAGNLRILDYGGGSARLGLSLKMCADKTLPDFQYEIYDPGLEYFGTEFKSYDDVKKIDGKFNCIAMMNVLHEIQPDEWCDVFRDVYNLLEDNAYLIFVEVGTLTNGEMPNKNGYFVLGKEELEVLFRGHSLIPEIKLKENQKSVCYIIPKSVISNITLRTIVDAIECLKKRSFIQIETVRGKNLKDLPTNDIEARKYAFWLQQYINTVIFEKEIKNAGGSHGTDRFFKYENVYKEKRIDDIEELLKSEDIVLSNNEIVNSTHNALLYALVQYRTGDRVSDDISSEYWSGIITLEKMRYPKESVAKLLKAALLMGDNRCKNRYYNNGYYNFITDRD